MLNRLSHPGAPAQVILRYPCRSQESSLDFGFLAVKGVVFLLSLPWLSGFTREGRLLCVGDSSTVPGANRALPCEGSPALAAVCGLAYVVRGLACRAH